MKDIIFCDYCSKISVLATLVVLLLSTSVKGNEDNFMMLSAYNLAPYNPEYLESVLPSMARHDVAGILYATLGHEEFRFNDTNGQWGLANELAYNKKLYHLAKNSGARIWLQIRLYDNAGGLSADDVRSFNISSIVRDYSLNVDECKIILFEEASIYHKPGGGGDFWFGANLSRAPQQHVGNDQLFVDNLADLFSHLKQQIMQVDPDCSVGIHIGHAPVYRTLSGTSLIASAVAKMPVSLKPDFIFYDLYARVIGHPEVYEQRLRSRLASLKAELGLPLYYMGQLHTTNYFQNGGAKSPTLDDLHSGVRIAREAGVAGIGFYTKNTHASKNDVKFRNFATNERVMAGLHEPQKTVFESSKDRFDYAMQLIGNTENTVDLFFYGKGLSRNGFVQRGYHGVPPAAGRSKLRLWSTA